MERKVVEIAMMRIVDLEIGDVVNRNPAAQEGWFPVEELRTLPDGAINITNKALRASVRGAETDIVGIQVTKTINFE